jgi:hypothetical protein
MDHTVAVRHSALTGLERGWAPVPVRYRGKEPWNHATNRPRADWENLRATPDTLPELFPDGTPTNLGFLLGEPSRGLLDADLDCPEARVAAPYLLPKTGAIFGRPGAPLSHWLYTTSRPCRTVKLTDVTGACLVELRGTGGQTVFPPSVHETTGETIAWHEYGEPTVVDAGDLLRRVREVAAAAMIARHWPGKGTRHELALALWGGLLRDGWAPARAGSFLRPVFDAARTGDVETKLRAGEDTAGKLEAGEEVTGWTRAAELLTGDGAKVVKRARQWLAPQVTFNGRAVGADADGTEEDEEAGGRGAGADGDHDAGGPSSPGGTVANPTGTAPWEPPVPFTRYDAPAFPVDVLPGWLADYVTALSVATQTPADLAAMLALSAAGAALARKYRVLARPGWSQPFNLYVLVALPPGNRKTAVFKDAMEPVVAFEREEAATLHIKIVERAAEKRLLEGRLRAAEAAAARAKGDTAEEKEEQVKRRNEALHLAQELGQFQELRQLQALADDITPEAVGKVLADQGGRLLVASAEGTILDIACGRYSETAHLDNFLKAHDGDTIRVNRIGREPDYVTDPALSMALAIQPVVIKGLADHASVRGKGFLARWLYSLPVSTVGARQIAPPAVPEEVSLAYASNMLALWQTPAAVGFDGKPTVGWFRFTPEADLVLQQFEGRLEPQLQEDAALSWVADWASKLAGAAVRIAGILHAASGIATGPTLSAAVPRDVVERAVRLAESYLLPHALAAFGLMGSDRKTADAQRVLRWIARSVNKVNEVNGVRVLSRRDVHANILGSRYSVEDVDAVLNLLTHHGFLRPAGAKGRASPGRVTPLCEISPYLFSAKEGGEEEGSVHLVHAVHIGSPRA